MPFRRFLPVLACVACASAPDPDPELLAALEAGSTLEPEESTAGAERDVRKEAAARAARGALASRLGLAADAVESGWTVEVMPGALAVGMVDGASGMCAVVLVVDDAWAVSSLGRPPTLPAGPAVLYAGLSDVRQDHMVRASDDFAELQSWRAQQCGGAP